MTAITDVLIDVLIKGTWLICDIPAFRYSNVCRVCRAHKVNRRQAREGALGYKVNRRQAREGALGYKVNRRQAREGALGYHESIACMLFPVRAAQPAMIH
jgi:hypothetical protein